MNKNEVVLLGHGGGGRLSRDLIKEVIGKPIANEFLDQYGDSALLNILENKIAFTTDSYVVSPPFFPGGDIGSLSVHGTINDLSVAGAKPLYISLALIIEEGFAIKDLKSIMESIADSAKNAGVQVVTGDTKVVNRKAADGIFINTTGIGLLYPEYQLSISNIVPGDAIIVNGPLGDHGAAIMLSREGLDFEHPIKTDSAPLNKITEALRPFGKSIKFMRDLTRGGLSAVTNEIVMDYPKIGIQLWESAIPIKKEVFSAFEILGLDPLQAANEGKLIVVVEEAIKNEVLSVMQKTDYGKEAAIIGRITEDYQGKVVMQTDIGGQTLVSLPEGELLPRIC